MTLVVLAEEGEDTGAGRNDRRSDAGASGRAIVIRLRGDGRARA